MPVRGAQTAALFITALLATPPAAQDRITPDQFLDLAAGRTLTFDHYPGGSRVGVEEFLSRSRSVWARSDGSCTYGEITVEGLHVCFLYDDDPFNRHCWVPFTLDDRVLVRAESGEIQEVTRITDHPVQCRDVPTS